MPLLSLAGAPIYVYLGQLTVGWEARRGWGPYKGRTGPYMGGMGLLYLAWRGSKLLVLGPWSGVRRGLGSREETLT